MENRCSEIEQEFLLNLRTDKENPPKLTSTDPYKAKAKNEC